MTLEQKRQALIQALRRDANLHERSFFEQLGSDFDRLDVKAGGEFENSKVQLTFGIAWTFWDSWIDERNHSFPCFYDGITREHWPILARRVAENLEIGEQVEDPLFLKYFSLKPSLPIKQ